MYVCVIKCFFIVKCEAMEQKEASLVLGVDLQRSGECQKQR
jgi:hypothetical protein